MTDDPDFDSFWAIFPRKDHKPEARYEWRQAARRFGAERVILTAARYCAQAQGRQRTDILTAAEWLPGLLEPEREPGTRGLDPEKMGKILLTASMTSVLMGHSSIAGTVRDYLLPHEPHDAEHAFVYRTLVGTDPHDLITEEEAGDWLGGLSLPALP